MQTTFQPKTAPRLLLALLMTALSITITLAQSDEQVIREIIKQENENQVRPKFTDDVISAPVGTPRPFVGKQAWIAGVQELNKTRPNTKLVRTPERIVVAASNDLAYEYGNQTMAWDKPEGGRFEGQGAYLRIWRKVNNEWLLEVFMARPNEK
jgi:ketosteroid isomerase-like protein